MNKINCAWLTLNRQCNLRCRWCYARGTDFARSRNMSFELARQLIDFLQDMDIREVALIGGEPTCYEELKNLVSYAARKEIDTWLITNGLKFENADYLNELLEAGLLGVNFSMKGWSKESYIDNTGADVFEHAIAALKNVCSSRVRCKVSFVISSENIDYLPEAVRLAADCGAKEFYLSIEHDFSALDGKHTEYDLDNLSKIIDGFSKCYEELNEITGGKFVLHESLPLCLWENEIIKQLTIRKQIYTSCSLLRRSGLVFDTDGSLLPCNAMYQVPLGKFKTDFGDRDSFNIFWISDKITSIYNAFRKLPSLKCQDCEGALQCGGGCISNWYHFKYDDLMKYGKSRNFSILQKTNELQKNS